jgi:hypothetical protein
MARPGLKEQRPPPRREDILASGRLLEPRNLVAQRRHHSLQLDYLLPV